jgi:hypothetical protein
MIGAAVHDPTRHFATANYRTAKDLFDHLERSRTGGGGAVLHMGIEARRSSSKFARSM